VAAAILFFCGGGISWGSELIQTTDGVKDGFVIYSGTYYSSSSQISAGSFSPSYWVYGVVKFPIDSSLTGKTITRAQLNLKLYYMDSSGKTYGGIYFQLQHYTADNTGDVSADDNSAAVENVGNKFFIAQTSDHPTFTLDVTSAVAADVAAGCTYTSFRLKPVDADGNDIDLSFYPYVAEFYTADGSAPDYKETLDIHYNTTGGTQSQVYAPGTKDGFVIYSGTYAGSGQISAGSIHPSYWVYGVAKFPLDSSLTGQTITQAQLNLKLYYMDSGGKTYGGIYFQLQHYTSDNTSDVSADDNSLAVEDVGNKFFIAQTSDHPTFTLDVTSAVAADVAAGHTYTSFRLKPVDADGNDIALSFFPYYAEFYTVDGSTPDYKETLDIHSTSWTPNPSGVTKDYLFAETTKDGSVIYSGTYIDNGQISVGQGSPSYWMYGVAKFPIDSSLTGLNIQEARLNLKLYFIDASGTSYGGVYVQLQHYLYDNSTDLVMPGDATAESSQIENVGDPVFIDQDDYSDHLVYSFDVTDAVNLDVTSGFAYTSFRLKPVDANGNDITLSNCPYYVVFYDGEHIYVTDVVKEAWEDEVTPGHRILIKKGLQIQAQHFPAYEDTSVEVPLNLDRFAESNFTTVNFGYDPTYIGVSHLGDAPGIPWGRWANQAMDIREDEWPYLSNMINFQYYDDAVDISNSTTLHAMKVWFENNRKRYPDVINNADVGGTKAYVIAAQPDMLMTNSYPFENGNLTGGSPTAWYASLQNLRLVGLAGLDGTGSQPIPYAYYLETYIRVGHTVSESEIRLNQFGLWAFGYKFASAFTYTDSHSTSENKSALFSSKDDSVPTNAFYQIAETNRQSRNLGPALVRLLSTDVRMIMGQHTSSGTYNTTPDGVTPGITGADDYLTDVSATNLGSCNNGLPGDVIVGFFKVLDESFDGTAYSNQKYFMVTNGLSDGSGSASATQQKIRLTFNMGSSGITSLQRLSRYNGKIEIVPLTSEGNGIYSLDLTLDGGTGDLFKYNTGAPFVAVDTLAGDFNGDGKINAADIDLLSAAIKTTNPDSKFDLNGDGTVNSADMDYLIKTILHTYYGDADLNGSVGVSDLSVLAAYYNTASGASWANGDFDGNGAVGVSDLSILAANYNSGSASTVSWAEAYAQAFGTTGDAETSSDEADFSSDDSENTGSTMCSSLGLSLIAGLALMGLMIVKLEE
jgi:hypothetical protein